MSRTRAVIAGVATLVVLLGALSVVSGRVPATAVGAERTGKSFGKVVDNPYFPLPVGRTLVYKGVRDGLTQTDRVHVTHKTKVIQGVTCIVVRDVARHGSRLLEKTKDWYAQDKQGNVWYFGEATAEYDRHGHVATREGSGKAGVAGALRGTIMPATPHVPDGYRQEFYRNHAEDVAYVLTRGGSMTLPRRTVYRVMRTLEWSRLEPGVIGTKSYAPGLGIVLERTLAGGDELAKLVRVING
jgi:hypothetical protein